MDVAEALSQYCKDSAQKLPLPWERYTMFISAAILVGAACYVFGILIAVSGWYAMLGLFVLWLLLIVHPWFYRRTLDESKGVIRAKPFLSFFYLCYMLVLPTMVVVYLGYGRAASLGVPIVAANSGGSAVTINFLSVNHNAFTANADYFETTDGFIAYNLTKSVVHTLEAHAMVPTDSIYFGLDNPIVDSIYGAENATYSNLYVSELNLFNPLAPSLLYPAIISQWTIAPIFQSFADCLTQQPPVHVTCALGNVVLGWAMSTDSSAICRSVISSSACTEWGITNLKMSVYYPEPFSTQEPIVTVGGMKGILSSSPPDYIVEALKRRYIADGWPFDVDTRNYPNGMPMLFVQIDDTIASSIQSASNEYTVFKYISMVFVLLVALAICVPFYLDFRTDCFLRKLIEAQKVVNEELARAEAQREQRRKRVADLSIN